MNKTPSAFFLYDQALWVNPPNMIYLSMANNESDVYHGQVYAIKQGSDRSDVRNILFGLISLAEFR